MVEIDNCTPEEYQQYRKSLENIGDSQTIINTATEEAEKRGLAPGVAQGREECRTPITSQYKYRAAERKVHAALFTFVLHHIFPYFYLLKT